MSEALSAKRLEEIVSRWADATRRPWVVEGGLYDDRAGEMLYGVRSEHEEEQRTVADCQRGEDMVAIAHAPEDIEALLGEVLRLRAAMQRTDERSEVKNARRALGKARSDLQRIEARMPSRKAFYALMDDDTDRAHAMAREWCDKVKGLQEEIAKLESFL